VSQDKRRISGALEVKRVLIGLKRITQQQCEDVISNDTSFILIP
jgi:hypothetical protein